MPIVDISGQINISSLVILSDKALRKNQQGENLAEKYFQEIFKNKEYWNLNNDDNGGIDIGKVEPGTFTEGLENQLRNNRLINRIYSFICVAYEELKDLNTERLTGILKTCQYVKERLTSTLNSGYFLILNVYMPNLNNQADCKNAHDNFKNIFTLLEDERNRQLNVSLFVIHKTFGGTFDAHVKATVRYAHMQSHKGFAHPELPDLNNNGTDFYSVVMSEFDVDEREALKEKRSEINGKLNGSDDFNMKKKLESSANEYIARFNNELDNAAEALCPKHCPLILKKRRNGKCRIKIRRRKEDIRADFLYAVKQTYVKAIHEKFCELNTPDMEEEVFGKLPVGLLVKALQPTSQPTIDDLKGLLTELKNDGKVSSELNEPNNIPLKIKIKDAPKIFSEIVKSYKTQTKNFIRNMLIDKLIKGFEDYIKREEVKNKYDELIKRISEIDAKLENSNANSNAIDGIVNPQAYLNNIAGFINQYGELNSPVPWTSKKNFILISGKMNEEWNNEQYGFPRDPDRDVEDIKVYNYGDLKGQEFQTLRIYTYKYDKNSDFHGMFNIKGEE